MALTSVIRNHPEETPNKRQLYQRLKTSHSLDRLLHSLSLSDIYPTTVWPLSLCLHESGLLLISCGGVGVSREGTPPLPRPPWLQSIAVVPRMCWGFWVAAILEACLTGPLCVCQMASVIGQLCPVTFGHCVPIVCAGEQTVQSLSPRVWKYYPKQHLSKIIQKQHFQMHCENLK